MNTNPDSQSNTELEAEIRSLGYEVETDVWFSGLVEYRATFRGFSTPWRETLAEVLADLEKQNEPMKARTI